MVLQAQMSILNSEAVSWIQLWGYFFAPITNTTVTQKAETNLIEAHKKSIRKTVLKSLFHFPSQKLCSFVRGVQCMRFTFRSHLLLSESLRGKTHKCFSLTRSSTVKGTDEVTTVHNKHSVKKTVPYVAFPLLCLVLWKMINSSCS